MKKLIAVLLLVLSVPTYADSIKCYSYGKLIYSHRVHDVTYTGDLFVFTEDSSDDLVFFNGNCLAKIQGE